MTKKKWNWQLDDWPNFSYHSGAIVQQEKEYLKQSGISIGVAKYLRDDLRQELIVQLIESEALNTSAIEGEILDRDSLQSSLRKEFGLNLRSHFNEKPAEAGIAEMMNDLYVNFDSPLTAESLCEWHDMLLHGRRNIEVGRFRTCKEAMQIVSGRYDSPKIHYEAPPSAAVPREMETYIEWFNSTAAGGRIPLSPLIRAAIAHLYFVSIHPFEDGNGRIGRALVEKALSQYNGQPVLIALSSTINENRRAYYNALGKNSKTNETTEWITYFADTVIDSQRNSLEQIDFIINKARFFDHNEKELNLRQLKVIKRIFREGTKGFQGGLSARNYKAITKTSDATVTRDLQDLVRKGIFSKTGQFKNARYYMEYVLLPE